MTGNVSKRGARKIYYRREEGQRAENDAISISRTNAFVKKQRDLAMNGRMELLGLWNYWFVSRDFVNASSLVGNVCSSFTFRAAFVHICPMSNAHSSFVGMIAISSLLYCLCFCVVPYASLMHPSLLHLLIVHVAPYPCLMCTALSFIDGLSCASLAIASFHFSSCLM